METVAQVARESLAVLRGNPSGPIERVANQRMSGCGKVNADLVRPAGCDSDLKQGAGLAPLEYYYLAVRGLSFRASGMNGL